MVLAYIVLYAHKSVDGVKTVELALKPLFHIGRLFNVWVKGSGQRQKVSPPVMICCYFV